MAVLLTSLVDLVDLEHTRRSPKTPIACKTFQPSENTQRSQRIDISGAAALDFSGRTAEEVCRRAAGATPARVCRARRSGASVSPGPHSRLRSPPTTAWRLIERGVALGVVERAGARRGSRSRASAQRAISRASGCGSSSSRRRPSRVRTMPASRHSAARVAALGAAGGAGERAQRARARRPSAARGGAGSDRARATARRANTKHSLSEFEARRLAPCRPVQEDSPTAYSPGTRRARVQVGDDPAHRVVGGRRDRDQLARRVEARLAQRGDDVGEVGGVDRAHVQADRRSRPSRAGAAWIARETSSRGASSSTKRSPCGSRAGSRPRRGSPRSRGSPRARARRSRRSGGTAAARGRPARRRRRGRAAGRRPASRVGWWCAPTAPRRRRSRATTARAATIAPVVAAAHAPRQRRRGRRSATARARAAPSSTVDRAARSAAERRELAHDAPPGGAAAGVDDAPDRVPALQAEREPPEAVGVEAHAERLQVAHAARAPRARASPRPSAGPASRPAQLGVAPGAARSCRRRRAPRRGRPAPSSWRSAPAASPRRARRGRPRARRTAPRTARPRRRPPPRRRPRTIGRGGRLRTLHGRSAAAGVASCLRRCASALRGVLVGGGRARRRGVVVDVSLRVPGVRGPRARSSWACLASRAGARGGRRARRA